jgi:hypothetical protein
LISAAFTWRLFYYSLSGQPPTAAAGGSSVRGFREAMREWIRMMRDGVAYIVTDRYLLVVVHVKTVAALSWSPQELLNLRMAATFDAEGDGALAFGGLYSVLGLATAIGPLVLGQLLPDTARGVELGLVAGFVRCRVAITHRMECDGGGVFVVVVGGGQFAADVAGNGEFRAVSGL